MTHVHIILSGIISIVPQPAQTTPGTMPSSWEVRLSDAIPHDHIRSVLAETPYATTSLNPVVRTYNKGAVKLSGWYLGGGKLTIASTIESAAIREKWPLDGVLAVKDGCTSNDCSTLERAKDENALYFEIAKGSLTTTSYEPAKWAFEPSSVGSKQIAEEVCWSFDIREDALVLMLEDSGGTPFTLTVTAPARGMDIELRLQQTELGDLFPTKGFGKSDDPHVKIYFTHSHAQPSQIPTLEKKFGTVTTPPHAHPHRLSDETIGNLKPDGLFPFGLRVNCPPGQWNGAM